MVKSLVIKLGGSTLFGADGTLLSQRIEDLLDLLEELSQQMKMAIVVGGGVPTRKLVNAMQPFGLSHSQLDHLSILQTQVHGSILQAVCQQRGMNTRFVTTYQQLLISYPGITICSGLFPGQSTNAVAALTAEIQGADLLINLFSYDKIHSIDPTTGQDGQPLDALTYRELADLISSFRQQPGHYELFDHQALNYVQRSGIAVLFLNGSSIQHIRDYLSGIPRGTIIRSK